MKMPTMSRYFEGYNVPERYKNTVSLIIRRFDISGSTDGKYICNCIAHISGTGDGAGEFTGSDVINADPVADFLMSAYRSNIPEDCKPELVDILTTGEINQRKSIDGLRGYIRRMRHETPLESGGCYTRDYIRRCIHNAADAIDEINGTLPKGYEPTYYTPGKMPD